jgi:hypothetical protein
MRISIDCDDPGYPNFLRFGRFPTVWLDDVAISFVVTADEERGEIVRLKTDASGASVLMDGENVQREVLRGVVKFE